MAQKKKTLDQCMKALQRAMQNLPEFAELYRTLPPFHDLEMTVVENKHLQVLSQDVFYRGCTPKNGLNSYLLQYCGHEYFQSDKALSEIAEIIQTVVTQERENPTLKERGLDWSGYSEDLRISLRLANILDATDEVYPHMRDRAIGVFSPS